jgi:hypothetical protein
MAAAAQEAFVITLGHVYRHRSWLLVTSLLSVSLGAEKGGRG